MRRAVGLAAVLALGLAGPAAGQQTQTWTATGGGAFNNAASWTNFGGGNSTTPGAADTAQFTAGASYTVGFLSSPTTAGLRVAAGTVGFSLNGYTYTVSNSFSLTAPSGATTATRLLVNNGTLQLNGSNAGLTGSELVVGAGGTVTAASYLDVGTNVTAVVTVQNGGTFNVGPSTWISTNPPPSGGGVGSFNSRVVVDAGGTFTAGSGLQVGYGNVGIVRVGGTAVIGPNLILGSSGGGSGSSGYLTVLSGGSLTTSGNVTVGSASGLGQGFASTAGTWAHTNAGTVNRIVGNQYGTAGFSNFLDVVPGGSLTVAGQAGSGVDFSAGGVVQVDGGSLTVTGAGNGLRVGRADRLVVTGGGTVTTPSLTTIGGVYPFGLTAGTLNVVGGVLDLSGGQSGFRTSLFLQSSSGTAALNLQAGATSTGVAAVYVGAAGGTNTVSVSGGSTLTTSEVRIGAAGSPTGTAISVTGAGSTLTNTGQLVVGYDGGGTLAVQGGGAATALTTYVGAFPGTVGGSSGDGRVSVTGAGAQLTAGAGLQVGYHPGLEANAGVGRVTVSVGGAVTAGGLVVGAGSNRASAVTVGGGGLASALTLTGPASVGSDGTLGTAQLTINPRGTVTAPSLAVAGNGTVSLTGGTLNLGADAQVSPGGQFNHTAGALNYTADTTITRPQTITGGTLSVDAGKTATFNTTALSGGTLAGPGGFATASGLGTLFTAVATAPSASLLLGGADVLTNSTLGGATTVQASGFAPLLSRTTNTPSGRLALDSTAQLSVADFVSTGLLTLADGTATTSRTRVTVTGASDLYFGGGSRTVVGTPAGAAAGNLAAVNLGGRQAVVAGGLFVNNGVVANGTVVADYGALVKGAGTFANPVVTRNGGAFQAGNSPGRATTGSFEFNAGGQLNFQINNATGAAGPTPDANNQVSGWSLVLARALNDPDLGTTTGDLRVTATPGGRYTLRLQTLQNPSTVGQDNFGPMANFDPSRPYLWTFLTYEGSYSGPTDLNTVFTIDAGQFVNSPAGGSFSIRLDQAAKTVGLTFTPVPEPGLLLAASGLALLAARRLRLV